MTAIRGVLWWVRSLMGDNDYQRFLTHHRQMHPDDRVPTEREYWRSRYADADRNPGARCC